MLGLVFPVQTNIIFKKVTLEPGVPTSFMLQLKNVREVVREGNDEPTGVVVTQVINGLDHANGNKCTLGW